MHPMNSAFFETFTLKTFAEDSPELGSLEQSQIVFEALQSS